MYHVDPFMGSVDVLLILHTEVSVEVTRCAGPQRPSCFGTFKDTRLVGSGQVVDSWCLRGRKPTTMWILGDS